MIFVKGLALRPVTVFALGWCLTKRIFHQEIFCSRIPWPVRPSPL